MSIRRHIAVTATACAVAIAALGGSVTAQADDPPTDGQAPPVTVAPPIDDPAQDEVVHSWALAPAGSDQPGEAGNRPTLSYAAAPGSTIEDAVTLYNFGNESLIFQVFATDAFNDDAGQFDVRSLDEEQDGVGAWIALEQDLVQVPPGQQVTIPITVEVPEDARTGDHAGAILAASDAVSPDEAGALVTVRRQTGTRVFVRVDGPIQPQLVVRDLTVDYDQRANPLDGTANITYRVENTGNVRISGASSVSVAGLLGVGETALPPVAIPELLPGGSATLTATASGIQALGRVTATVTVTPDPTGDGAELGEITASASTFALPIALLLVVLAILLGALAWRAVRRHRTSDELVVEPEREPQPT
jgi:hypothetical protein